MEALWNLEDKWKVSTKAAAAIALCACAAASLLLAAVWVVLRRGNGAAEVVEDGGGGGGEEVKKLLMRSVRWSGACKWEEKRRRRGRVSMSPLLAAEVGWQSNNSDSPVWQRPILMGEKCELPSFSGLILYDDEGRPLHNNSSPHHHQVDMSAGIERVTLKELL
ncbi:PREDICTED: uncharacterized protein LOC109155760 [Ipomoea nil]|uniref:uncharacterized protein LOC109155760 n=1 Tax=Ipomoea nil TaxID=35883 RepID=UPI000900B488|nr:PREDICTED: uncharacterized protein LOC109155760 [Ipomoea nil]